MMGRSDHINNQHRIVIGLTGHIASGKSSVAKILGEMGALVLDADQLARQVVAPGSQGLQELVTVFGPGILNADGSLNRSQLGSLVFDHRENLEKLNNITHPQITHLFQEKLEAFRSSNEPAVMVVEAALLFEAGWDKLVDQVWFVTAPLDARVQRLMNRNGLSRKEAMKRIRSQTGEMEKMEQARQIISNDGDMEALVQTVRTAYHDIAIK